MIEPDFGNPNRVVAIACATGICSPVDPELYSTPEGTAVLSKRFSGLVFLLALSPALYADNPFVGKWKIDKSKSRIAGSVDSVTTAGPNTWTFAFGDFSWTVKADGTQQPTPFGTTSMKVINPTTWQFTNMTNHKPSGTETWVLSADGQSMTRTYSGTQANGQPFSGVANLKRIAGASGFAGRWQSTEVQMTFSEVDIAANGPDGISLLLPEDGTKYSLKFDGKEYPEEGPRIPPGLTVSARMTGPRTVAATTRLNGKVLETEEWEVSPDGSTYTYIEHDTGAAEPVVIILHRAD